MAKQIIVMRRDLQMTKGKMIAQGAHASLGVILDMMQTEQMAHDWYQMKLDMTKGLPLYNWIHGIFTKVCVSVNSEEELLDIFQKATDAGLPVKLIEDNGLTMFHGVKTKTCLAIGPAENEEIDAITGHLKLL